MRRANSLPNSTPSLPGSSRSMSSPPVSGNPRPPTKQKRAKSIQACLSCRKLKTRCELLEVQEGGNVQCHRCTVLNLQCSFLEMENPPLPPSPRPSTAPHSPPASSTYSSEPQRSPTGPPLGYDGYPRVEAASVRFWAPLASSHASNLDWSAPMRAIEQLSTETTYVETPSIELRNSLGEIVSPTVKSHLLEIFNSQFAGWLPFAVPDTSPLVDIAKCSVASRQLNIPNRDTISTRLRRLVERFLSRAFLDISHFESPEACQALLILATWAPLSGDSSSSFKDCRGILSLALAIARNLRLDQASVSALMFPHSPNIIEMGAPPRAVDLAGVWMSLTVMDSWLCVGSGRTPCARRSQADRKLILQQQEAMARFDSPETRQRLMSEFFDAAEQGICLQLNSLAIEDVEVWYAALSTVLEFMDTLSQDVDNAGQGQESGLWYSHVLKICYHYCRIAILYHAIFEARYLCQQQGVDDPLAHIRPQRKPILAIWTSETLASARAFLLIIDSIRSPSGVAILATCPDQVFSMITFIIALLLGSNIMALSSQYSLQDFDPLIASVLSQLSHCTYSLPAEHAVHKTVHLVTSMLSVWRQAREQPHLLPPTFNPHSFLPNSPPGSGHFFFDPAGFGNLGIGADFFVSDLPRCRGAQCLMATATNPTTMTGYPITTTNCFVSSF